jgi:putative restriction endonuclease
MNPDGSTILIGYEPDRQWFAGFDLRKHKVFSSKSPSIQININAIHTALRDGMSFTTKGNDEIAIGFRPDQILTYALNAEILHAQGADAKTVALLTKATSEEPITESELAALPKERQKVIQTVEKLARDSAFRRKVIVAYDRKCAVTGIQLRLIDAAHILPVGATGSNDEVNNGLCLSPTYHRAYDRGLIYLDESRKMRINPAQEQHLIGLKLHGGLELFKAPLGNEIFLPPDKKQWPNSALIRKANEFRKIAA